MSDVNEALKVMLNRMHEQEDNNQPLPEAKAEAEAEWLIEFAHRRKEKTKPTLYSLVALDPDFSGNIRYPRTNQPALVVEVLEDYFRDEQGNTSSFRCYAPVDVRIICLGKNNGLINLWFDHKDLIPWKLNH